MADGSSAADFGSRLVYLRLPEASGINVFIQVAEEASLTSGKLQIVLVEKVGRILRADILARVLTKRPLDRDAKSFPAQEIRAESPGGHVPVQIDGELWGHLPMSFRIEPAAIKLIR